MTEVLPGMTRTGFAAARWPGNEAGVAAYYDDQPALLAPRDVARAVRFTLDQPPGVCCSEIAIVPTTRRPDDT